MTTVHFFAQAAQEPKPLQLFGGGRNKPATPGWTFAAGFGLVLGRRGQGREYTAAPANPPRPIRRIRALDIWGVGARFDANNSR
ncbi:MAG: hypothetical protein AB7U20_01030 [Planctomycetaceae bacterium]